jgi:hypothetical protein
MGLLQTNANKPIIHEREHVLFVSFAFALLWAIMFSNQKLGAKKGFFFLPKCFLNFGHEKGPNLGPSMIGVPKRSV